MNRIKLKKKSPQTKRIENDYLNKPENKATKRERETDGSSDEDVEHMFTNLSISEERIPRPGTKVDFDEFGKGGIMINNEMVRKSDITDNELSDSFDHNIRLRRDARGIHVVNWKPKKKKEGRSMAKIVGLKKRGIVYGKGGKRNFKRTFKTKISLKKVSLDGFADPNDHEEETFDLDEDGELGGALSGRRVKMRSRNGDGEEELYHRGASYARSTAEAIMPMQSFEVLNSSEWLN